MTISFALAREEIAELDRLAKKAGSRSAAVRDLIARHRRAERERELDDAYREYYSDPEIRREKEALTADLLRVYARTHRSIQGGGTRGRGSRSPRRRASAVDVRVRGKAS